jgi:hypothetical protein
MRAAVTEAAVTAAAVISLEAAVMEDSPEAAVTHRVQFPVMEDHRTTLITARTAEEFTEGTAAADTAGIITEGMHQEGPYSELF